MQSWRDLLPESWRATVRLDMLKVSLQAPLPGAVDSLILTLPRVNFLSQPNERSSSMMRCQGPVPNNRLQDQQRAERLLRDGTRNSKVGDHNLYAFIASTAATSLDVSFTNHTFHWQSIPLMEPLHCQRRAT